MRVTFSGIILRSLAETKLSGLYLSLDLLSMELVVF